jgi:biopolymer transport protein ExbD
MGVSIQTGGKGNKKPLDAELNLVPFIDLLCCTISFLLITAVWTQLARINVSQKTVEGKPSEDMKEVPKPTIKITVVIDQDGYRLSTGAGDVTPIPKKDGAYDNTVLREKLQELKRSHPDKNDVHVASEDTVKYEYIVTAMDVCLDAKFQEIGLTDVGAAAL